MRNEEGLRMTGAGKEGHFARDQIPRKSRDFSSDARALA
jgi:hypothetical protein